MKHHSTRHHHILASHYRQLSAVLLLGTVLTASAVEVFAAPSGRERILFDSNWRFQKGDIGRTDGVAVEKWRWKPEPRGMQAATEEVANSIRVEEDWKEAKPGQDLFGGKKGFAWCVTTLSDLPKGITANRALLLHFESVDDNATVFLNGKKVATHQGWSEPFDVTVDASLQSGGKIVVALLVENNSGPGGVGPAMLRVQDMEAASGPAATQFDDKQWRAVHLPHDFVVEGQFTPKGDAGHGSLLTDVGWYRKTFDIPATDKGRKLWLEFDGVYRNSDVWLNGKLLGNHKSGYTGFRYDITDVVRFGSKNVLAVRADARAQEGWWYEGGGIYRHVWLTKTDPVHIAPEGVYVTSSVAEDGRARIDAEIEIDRTAATEDVAVELRLLNPDGKAVAEQRKSLPKDPSGALVGTLKASIPVAQPRLWSLETPSLYRLVTTVILHGKQVDSVTTNLGIRTLKWDADKGFFLNGKPVKIQGTCNHQDFAGVGIAMPDSLLEWRIKKLKEMGCNAYRMSHNPPAKELLDACDRLGMLVMDENRHLGDTYQHHTPSGTTFDDLSDLKALILRDRNHPSIIMWSMCNEEGLQGSAEGARIFGAMKALVLKYDTTRPISCAMNGGWGSGISLVQDLQGCNYNPGGYDGFHARFPKIPMYGSETASAVSTRGEYVNEKTKGYVSAYDVNAPSWAQPAEVAWKALALRPFMAGGFVWTGFDYKGEPTPYGWPCINSHFGIMDECGFPKDTYYYYLAWWGTQPVAHILPHWNWPGKEGQQVDVWVHGNADHYELFLNGNGLGSKPMPRYGHLEWKVPYAPGKLEAKGYDANGKVIVTDVVETTDAPAKILLKASDTKLLANGEEVSMVEVSVVDSKGRIVPYADNEITFQVSGAGSIAGVGNGDPSSHEPDKANKRHAFHGLCMVVVQAGEKPGKIELTAEGAGLTAAKLELQAVQMRK